MSSYLQSDAGEVPRSDLVVVREKNRLTDLVGWTAKKIRCGKQQLMERVAPQKCARSSDPAFDQLHAEFDRERLAYEAYVSLLHEYSLQLETLSNLDKELSSLFGEMVPLEIGGLAAKPANSDRSVSSEFDLITSQGTKQQSADPKHAENAYVASMDSTKVNLGDTMNHLLAKRRANAIRAALYTRALDCADERLATLTNVAMYDAANAFARANEARLEFDAARNGAANQNAVAVARDRYERAKQDASTKMDLLNAHKTRSVERALALLNESSYSYYAAQRDRLCATLRHFSVSVPADLNSLLTDRSLLSGASGNSGSAAVINVRSLSRSMSMSALQVKTYTKQVKGMIAKAKTSASKTQQ